MIYLGNWFSRRDDEISLSSKLSVLSRLSLGRGEGRESREKCEENIQFPRGRD